MRKLQTIFKSTVFYYVMDMYHTNQCTKTIRRTLERHCAIIRWRPQQTIVSIENSRPGGPVEGPPDFRPGITNSYCMYPSSQGRCVIRFILPLQFNTIAMPARSRPHHSYDCPFPIFVFLTLKYWHDDDVISSFQWALIIVGVNQYLSYHRLCGDLVLALA